MEDKNFRYFSEKDTVLSNNIALCSIWKLSTKILKHLERVENQLNIMNLFFFFCFKISKIRSPSRASSVGLSCSVTRQSNKNVIDTYRKADNLEKLAFMLGTAEVISHTILLFSLLWKLLGSARTRYEHFIGVDGFSSLTLGKGYI